MVACAFEGCDRPVKTGRLCASHYMQRWTGRELSPLRPKLPQRPRGLSLEQTVFWFLRQGVFRRGCILLDTRAKTGNCYPTAQWQGRKTTLAHLVLEWKTGVPPEKGRVMLHSCDEPLCINPDHLRWGTARENAMDCVNRGRHARTHY